MRGFQGRIDSSLAGKERGCFTWTYIVLPFDVRRWSVQRVILVFFLNFLSRMEIFRAFHDEYSRILDVAVGRRIELYCRSSAEDTIGTTEKVKEAHNAMFLGDSNR